MTIKARHLMRRAYGAFRSGEIAERASLKDAMSWLNFQNSVSSRRLAADFFHRLDSDALAGLPSKPARSSSSEHCQGICTAGKSRFHWVIVTKDFATDLPRKASPKYQALYRSRLIKWANENISKKKRAILWLSELDEKHFQDTQPLALLGELGSYNQTLNREDHVVIYTVEVESVYKPTMIDAGFAFYWLAWQDADSYGMTLGLIDGQPTHKEWVVPKGTVEVVDAWFLMPGEGSLVDEKLPPAYWDACRQRVLDRHNLSGGTT
jgi:hypothetical protein